jgi:hypothetical protein
MPDRYWLARGAHSDPRDGRCSMEWIAYIAGEEHSDHPVCVDPVLGAFGRRWNDALDDVTRQRLRPYLARMIGTAGDGRSLERSWMCFDWLVRVHTPAWLDLAGLDGHARALRSLAAITDAASCDAAMPTVRAAWDAAGDAARAAAWDAARAAAWDAAGDAARAAAGDAAWAAAGDAARAAAWDAARDAARAAAGKALEPTIRILQESAFGLLDRMLPGELVELPRDVRVRAVEVRGVPA